MQINIYPNRADADLLLARPADTGAEARRAQVADILNAIKTEGDAAVRRFSAQFDGFTAEQFAVGAAEIAEAEAALSEPLKQAIRQAHSNIAAFHRAQKEPLLSVETMPGVVCRRKSVPIEKVGLYIPGGTAPLFSTVLMLGVPAQIAGCREVILCTPPQKDGRVHPAVLYSAQLCGIKAIYKIGGVQAVGAMTYGAAGVPKVWKICGPGNAWVTAAKQLISLEGTAIDMPAGPSEVAVLADATARPDFIAADLLSQAEHGSDSQVLFVTTEPGLVENVQAALEKQLADLPRNDMARQALQHSKALVVKDLDEALFWLNAYAPEHLILQIADPEALAERVVNAGSVFLGHFTPESAGDYASGTNHTLPTSAYARAYAGVSVDTFVKKITFQHITPEGLQALGPVVMEMAQAEGLDAHARAVSVRLAAAADSKENAAASPEKTIALLARPGIRALKPYSSARDEFKIAKDATGLVFLDANENSLGGPLADDFSRYPDPRQMALKQQLAAIKGVRPEQIFLGNGSDEAIDMLMRAFCEPGRDNIVTMPPTYGMYQVQADIHGAEVRKAYLNADFQPDEAAVMALTDANSRILFICSPNNPTGQCLPEAFVEAMLRRFPGIVVVDEAYADFSEKPSWISRIDEFPRLVVMQTLSKAWGLAALRIGMAYANAYTIDILNKIKYPYNLNKATTQLAAEALAQKATVDEKVRTLLAERARLMATLPTLPCIVEVFPSDSNFILARTTDADGLYQYLCNQAIVVRNRTKERHCHNCLRITVGTPAENDRLLEALARYPLNA